MLYSTDGSSEEIITLPNEEIFDILARLVFAFLVGHIPTGPCDVSVFLKLLTKD